MYFEVELTRFLKDRNQVQRGPEGVPAAVEEDRKHLVEAVIVRIMKSRKT